MQHKEAYAFQCSGKRKEENMLRSLSHTFCFLASSILLAACATAMQPSEVWKDSSYHSLPKKIMVVGISRKPVNRRIFEDEFVRQIMNRGSEAVASYTVLPDELQSDHKAIAAEVKKAKADTVLITRVASKKTEKTYMPGLYYPPPYYGTWPDYYGYGYNSLYVPGYVTEEEISVVETNLYDAATNKLIWASSTDIVQRGTAKERIFIYIDIVMKSLNKDGLLY